MHTRCGLKTKKRLMTYSREGHRRPKADANDADLWIVLLQKSAHRMENATPLYAPARKFLQIRHCRQLEFANSCDDGLRNYHFCFPLKC